MERSRFLIWDDSYIEGYCVIEFPEGIEKSYQLEEGFSRAKDWPKDVFCVMNDEYPKDIQLADSLYGAGIKVVADGVKQFLEEKQSNIEFLPVDIHNHKGRLAAGNYFIVNPLLVIDCIDLEASKVEWNDIDEELIDSCARLILKEELVPPSVKIFRPKYLPFVIIVQSELASQLNRAGFVGFSFRELTSFRGI